MRCRTNKMRNENEIVVTAFSNSFLPPWSQNSHFLSLILFFELFCFADLPCWTHLNLECRLLMQELLSFHNFVCLTTSYFQLILIKYVTKFILLLRKLIMFKVCVHCTVLLHASCHASCPASQQRKTELLAMCLGPPSLLHDGPVYPTWNATITYFLVHTQFSSIQTINTFWYECLFHSSILLSF